MHDAAAEILETRVPARLDRLPWGRFHTLVVAALGITWVLDGLEVTLAGSIAGALEASPRLRFTASDIGLASSFYLAGAVIGALGFGWMTDRLGRRLLFFITLGLNLISTTATAFAWNLESFCLFRMLTGAGIGGEYSAVNSTIQEMIPARYRGWTDLAINGSFWIPGALGAAASIFVLSQPASIPTSAGGSLFLLVPRSASLSFFCGRGSQKAHAGSSFMEGSRKRKRWSMKLKLGCASMVRVFKTDRRSRQCGCTHVRTRRCG
jgi:MFS family permease